MRTPTSREENNSCLEAQKTGFTKKKSTAKLISCLEVKKIDFTKKSTAKSASKVYNTDFIQTRAPTARGNQTRASRSKEIDFTMESTVKNKFASRSKTTTSPTGEHPPERERKNHKARKESSDTEGQKAKFTQNPQTKPHTVIKNKKKIKKSNKKKLKIKNKKFAHFWFSTN